MARSRSIHPNMLKDEAFFTLSIGARVALLGLGTFAGPDDKFRWDDAEIARHLGSEVAQFVPELIRAGLISRIGDIGEVIYTFGFGRRRVSRWERLRQFIFDRDGRHCTYCGAAAAVLHCDHIIPASRGGTSEPDNLTTACKRCNLSKHDRTPEEWLPQSL